MKTILTFLVKLVAASIILFAAGDLILKFSQFILIGSCSLLGLKVTSSMLPYDSSEKLAPLIALILALPRISFGRRGVVILVGILLFFLMDLASIVLWVSPLTSYNTQSLNALHDTYSSAWNTAGRWIIPFFLFLWAAKDEIALLSRKDPAVS